MDVKNLPPFVVDASAKLVESYQRFLGSGFTSAENINDRLKILSDNPKNVTYKTISDKGLSEKSEQVDWENFYKNVYVTGITDDISGEYLATNVMSFDSYTALTPIYTNAQFRNFGVKNMQEYLLYLAYESATHVSKVESPISVDRKVFLLHQKFSSVLTQQIPRLFCTHTGANGKSTAIHWCDSISEIKDFNTILKYIAYKKELRIKGFISSPYINQLLFDRQIPVDDVLKMNLYNKDVPLTILGLISGVYTPEDIMLDDFTLPKEISDMLVESFQYNITLAEES